jgi:hypothetical protein
MDCLSEQFVSRVAREAGFEGCAPPALRFLQSLLREHTALLALALARVAHHHQRTSPSLADFALAHFDLAPLLQFLQNSPHEIHSPLHTNKIKHTQSKKQKVLPAFPPKHSYLATKIPLHPAQPTIQTREQQKKEKKGIMENLLRIRKVDTMFAQFGVLDVGKVNYTQ